MDNKNREYTYDEFFWEVWDYVSENIVSKELFNKHKDSFYEITFDLYQVHQNNSIYRWAGFNPTRIYARIIESFVKNFGIK